MNSRERDQARARSSERAKEKEKDRERERKKESEIPLHSTPSEILRNLFQVATCVLSSSFPSPSPLPLTQRSHAPTSSCRYFLSLSLRAVTLQVTVCAELDIRRRTIHRWRTPIPSPRTPNPKPNYSTTSVTDDRWILFVNGRWPITLSAQYKRGALAISPAIVVLCSLL